MYPTHIILFSIIAILCYFVYGYVTYSISRSRAIKGMRISNGMVVGTGERDSDVREFSLPLRRYTSTWHELLLIFGVLGVWMLYSIVAYLNRMGLYFDASIYTNETLEMGESMGKHFIARMEADDIASHCLIRGTVLFVSMWMVLLSAVKLFGYPRITFDDEGLHFSSRKASHLRFFSIMLLSTNTIAFIGLMLWYQQAIGNRHGSGQGLPYAFIVMFLVLGFIALHMIMKNVNLPFHSFYIAPNDAEVKEKNVKLQNKFDSQRFTNLPETVAWKFIDGVEYRLIKRRKIEGKRLIPKFFSYYCQGLKIQFCLGVLDSVYLPIDGRNYNLCELLFFIDRHDHRIFLPLSHICKAHKVNMRLMTDH